MTHTEFNKAAKKQFLKKIRIGRLKCSGEIADRLGLNRLKIERYPAQAWLVDTKCPVCGTEVMGLFGSFSWDLCHGEGYCSNCKKAHFRYYHYIQKGKPPLKLLALSGF